jgi:hypothetical protein
MNEHLFKNWPIYILGAGFIWLVVYTYISSHKEEKKRQEEEKLKEKK